MASRQKKGGGKVVGSSAPPSILRSVLTSGAVIGLIIAILVAVFNKLFFFGLDIEQIRQAGTQTLSLVAEPGRHVFSFGGVLKVSNNTKDPFLIKNISADSIDVQGIRYSFVSAQVVKEGEKLPQRREAFEPRSGPVESGLSVQVRPESQQLVSVTFYFDVKGPTKSDRDLYEALLQYGHEHGLTGGASIEGKYRDFPLEFR